jgi:hypothetical protein
MNDHQSRKPGANGRERMKFDHLDKTKDLVPPDPTKPANPAMKPGTAMTF